MFQNCVNYYYIMGIRDNVGDSNVKTAINNQSRLLKEKKNLHLLYDLASVSEIKLCNKIDSPLV